MLQDQVWEYYHSVKGWRPVPGDQLQVRLPPLYTEIHGTRYRLVLDAGTAFVQLYSEARTAHGMPTWLNYAYAQCRVLRRDDQGRLSGWTHELRTLTDQEYLLLCGMSVWQTAKVMGLAGKFGVASPEYLRLCDLRTNVISGRVPCPEPLYKYLKATLRKRRDDQRGELEGRANAQ